MCITLFTRTILSVYEANFCSKFNNKLRTIPATEKEYSLKISILEQPYVVYKIAASATQLVNYTFCFMLIHVQLRLPAERAQTKLHISYKLFKEMV